MGEATDAQERRKQDLLEGCGKQVLGEQRIPTLTRPPSTTFGTASTSPCTTYSWASSSSPPLPSLCSSLPHVTLRSHGSENTKDIIGLIQAGSREPTSGLEPLTPAHYE